MKENEIYSIKYESDMPEQVSIVFETNGPQGGDSGHGGFANLKIIIDGGDHQLKTFVEGEIVLSACGDWELTGLENALIDIGLRLALRRIERGE